MNINKNIDFKKEYQELLNIFGFVHRVGDLNSPNFEDVYFVKSENDCYHNLSFVWGRTLNPETYYPCFDLHTNFHNYYKNKDINEKCSSISELKEILKRRFPKEWKRKNIIHLL